MSIGSISSMNAAGLAQSRANHSLAATQRLADQYLSMQPPTGAPGTGAQLADQSQVREKFDAFVGESFYGQLLHEMHKTVGKTAYFNGGRAEEAFQGQLDQVLSEKMSQANASQFTGQMFDLFNAQMQAANRR
jgi:Rod binding protein